MREQVNPHYDQLISKMESGKDSIFEPCRVMDFNPKTLMAKIYGIRSKQTKENVIVLFPSFFSNTGIITMPVNGSVGLSFIGPHKETYLMSGQFMPPVKETHDSVVKSNSSPGQFDSLLTLENFEPGEVLLRSLKGAQVFISNSGDVEMTTSKMHRISLSEADGSFEQAIEKLRQDIGYYQMYNGTYEPKRTGISSEHHIFEKMYESVPKWESDEELTTQQLNELIENTNDFFTYFPLEVRVPIFEKQVVNVFQELNDEKVISAIDGSPLFYQSFLRSEDGHKRITRQISKDGSIDLTIGKEEENKKIRIINTEKEFSVNLEHPGIASTIKLTDEVVELKMDSGNISAIRVKQNGEVELQDANGTYSLTQLINRVNELSALSNLDSL